MTDQGGPDTLRWHAVSPRLISLRAVQVALVAVPVAVLAGAGVAAGAGPGPGAGVAAAVVAGGAVAFLLARRRVRAWAYAEREDDLLVRRGLLVRRLSVVPYGRMQFVDVTSGPLSRRYGLAEVRLHTAATASDARVPGLPAAEADRLRDRLAALGEARAAGL